MQFNGTAIVDVDQGSITELLESWIAKVETVLKSNEVAVYSEPKLISVFYRYVQWGFTVGKDVRKKLADFVISYLKDQVSNSDKKYLKSIIKTERDKFNSKNWEIEKNPMGTLFDTNAEVIQLIEK